MDARQLWNDYQKINPTIGDEIDAWAFGGDPDGLAQLVLDGIKTATTSAYELYQFEQETLPKVGTYNVILDGKGRAICIIEMTKVSLVPFGQVSEEHAYKEGEGDRSLTYWRQVHREFFEPYFKEVALSFNEDSLLVLEEFQVVYPISPKENKK